MQDKIFDLIKQEKKRQQETLGLIPSENIASKAVMTAVGSCLMNKYAEGQVGRRYYQGNEVADEVEGLAKARALKAFGLTDDEWGVSVQPHSGCEANVAVYNALLNPGDRIMSMYLPDGGHLSHGWQVGDEKVTLVSKIFEVEFYKIDPVTRLFDYDKIAKQANKYRPKLMITGGTAYPREIDYERMGKIAKSVGAYYLTDVAHEAGLIAAGVMKSPFVAADVVTFTTHKTLRGPRGACIISRRKLQITNNKLQNKSKIKNANVQSESDLASLIDKSIMPGLQGGPHLHTIAGIAVALGEVMTPEFKRYARQVVKNAQVLAEGLQKAGFDVVSGGTDKHLVLVDLRNKGLSGWTVAWALEAAGIVANRNTVPAETASPFYPSGLRMGTPIVTSRGMKEKEMKMIVKWITEVVAVIGEDKLPEDVKARRAFTKAFVEKVFGDKRLAMIREEVKQLCKKFPIDR